MLDEIIRLLRLVENNKNPIPRTHELLQEMRDISSMAMEHFEENILPKLRTQLEAQTGRVSFCLCILIVALSK